MRTTIAIDDHLLAQAKARAAERRITLGRYVEEALALRLVSPEDRPRRAVPVFRGGTGPAPGVDATSNRSMLDAIDED